MRHHDLEVLLICQMDLKHKDAKGNANHLFEIERAIDEIQGGWSCSHTDTVMRWAHAYLGVTA